MRVKYLNKRRVPVGVVEWHPSMSFAFIVVDYVFRKHTGRDAVLSGGQEDAHSVKSLHYGVEFDPRSRAADFTFENVSQAHRALILVEAENMLGPCFDVVNEDSHMHVEFQMKVTA